jgi:hypothetical protein
MSDRGRVVLIFAMVGLLAGGGGYYFIKIYRPAQDLKTAQDEVTSWETRFQTARDCLLGKSPGSAKTSEALAIREMAPDPWDRGRCTPLISQLNRGEAPDTRLPVVEEAWRALDKSAAKAALAFARHVSESTTLASDPLPGALDELDAARRTLRTAAKMPLAQAAGSPLAAAQMLPIADGTERLTRLLIDTIPSAHGMVLFGQTESRTVQIKLVSGATPEVRRVGPGTIRAVPDMAWGATPVEGEVRAGSFDAEGVLAAPMPLPMVSPTIAAVAGTLAEGVLVYGNQTQLVVARANGGVITPGTPTTIGAAQAGLDVDGRIALTWSDGKVTNGQILKPGGDEAVVELPPTVGQLCLTADRAWTQTSDTAISFGAGRPAFTKALRERLQGCTAEAALFHAATRPTELQICSDDCRGARMPTGAPQFATTTVVGGKLVAIASHGGVLGVWREGVQPTFYALPEAATPVMAHEWPAMALTDGKVIDVIARGDTGFFVIRVPAV